jgi:predicted short-subunit dehydrogenase-like oxidoreductase (DUF2520 family)
MTFTGTSVDLIRLSGCSFGITAPDALRPVAEALVVELGGEPVWVPGQFRSLYHAALAYGANGLATLVNETVTLLGHAGIDDAASVVAPLLSASLDNALRNSDAATTGPVIRGDAGTVAAHVLAIREMHARTLESYRALARLTVIRATEARLLRDEQADAVLKELGD